jgi:hypothetical protein
MNTLPVVSMTSPGKITSACNAKHLEQHGKLSDMVKNVRVSSLHRSHNLIAKSNSSLVVGYPSELHGILHLLLYWSRQQPIPSLGSNSKVPSARWIPIWKLNLGRSFSGRFLNLSRYALAAERTLFSSFFWSLGSVERNLIKNIRPTAIVANGYTGSLPLPLGRCTFPLYIISIPYL